MALMKKPGAPQKKPAGRQRNGIGAVLIVKNEEAVLERCLRSLEGVDQLVVLDTGSTDRTLEIAGRFTTDVSSWKPPEPFHFADARNRALEGCGQEWALTIDADEILMPGALDMLRQAIKNYFIADGFHVTFTLFDEEGKNPGRLPKLKLFRTSRWLWQNRIHEILYPRSVPAPVRSVPEAVIEHRPPAGREARRQQNLDLLKISVQESPEYVRNIRQLGMEYYARQDWGGAIPHLEQYMAAPGAHQVDRMDRSETLSHLGTAYAMTLRYDAAEKAFDEAEKCAPERRETLYHKGVALIKCGVLDAAIETLERALRIPVSMKPDYYLNIEAVWDGSAINEALEWARPEWERVKTELEKKKAQGA